MRRLAVLAGCAAAVSGCGGGGGSTATKPVAAPQAALVAAGLEPPAGCYVTVFLIEDATRAQVAQVQKRLLASKAIEQVSFVSKQLQLRRFAQANPTAAKGMHVNPFSDRFEVVPRTRGGVFAIVSHFALEGGPITNARPSSGCRNRVR